MRLDHLLSRERTRREIGSFIPGRYTVKEKSETVWSSKELKAEEAKKSTKQKAEWSNDCLIFLKMYRFQGSESESLKKPECTLKTAQPDGKTSCKETSCEALEREHARRNANNFAVGLRRKS